MSSFDWQTFLGGDPAQNWAYNGADGYFNLPIDHPSNPYFQSGPFQQPDFLNHGLASGIQNNTMTDSLMAEFVDMPSIYGNDATPKTASRPEYPQEVCDPALHFAPLPNTVNQYHSSLPMTPCRQNGNAYDNDTNSSLPMSTSDQLGMGLSQPHPEAVGSDGPSPTGDPHSGSPVAGTDDELKYMSYARLLYLCLVEAPNFTLPLKDIYDWIATNAPSKIEGSGKGYQNSIRHNLSLNAAFIKVDNNRRSPVKSCWTLHPDFIQGGKIKPTTTYRGKHPKSRRPPSHSTHQKHQAAGAKGGIASARRNDQAHYRAPVTPSSRPTSSRASAVHAGAKLQNERPAEQTHLLAVHATPSTLVQAQVATPMPSSSQPSQPYFHDPRHINNWMAGSVGSFRPLSEIPWNLTSIPEGDEEDHTMSLGESATHFQPPMMGTMHQPQSAQNQQQQLIPMQNSGLSLSRNFNAHNIQAESGGRWAGPSELSFVTRGILDCQIDPTLDE